MFTDRTPRDGGADADGRGVVRSERVEPGEVVERREAKHDRSVAEGHALLEPLELSRDDDLQRPVARVEVEGHGCRGGCRGGTRGGTWGGTWNYTDPRGLLRELCRGVCVCVLCVRVIGEAMV